MSAAGPCDSDGVIRDLIADEEPEVTEIESLCFNCHENGITRLLLTRIAFFREVIVSSFSCSHCGYENKTLNSAAEIQSEGQRLILEVRTERDLNRRVVMPCGSTLCIPQLDASFPTNDGMLTTIEGVITTVSERLQHLQPERKKVQTELAEKLDSFTQKLGELLKLQQSFTFELDDPSGNGYIENYLAPNPDPQLQRITYQRTAVHNALLGLLSDANEDEPETEEPRTPTNEQVDQDNAVTKDEVLKFRVNCPSCNAPSSSNMKVVNIPHFKEVIIMATVCSSCGYRDSEVKSGTGVAAKGRLYRLRLTHSSDLSRDVLIAETASVNLPDLELECEGSSLGGRFTTMEGVLLTLREQLVKTNPFILGDSTPVAERTGKFAQLVQQLTEIASGQRLSITFELKDPAGNSYIQNMYAPDPDPNMEVVDYVRSAEENDELGLTDMNTAAFEVIPLEKFGDA